MANNQFGPSRPGNERSRAQIQAEQKAARAADAKLEQAGRAAGRNRRSIGGGQ